MRISDEVVKEHYLYKRLQEELAEACDYIESLSSSCSWMSEELRYLNDFIRYKGLDEEFDLFHKNAHLDGSEDLPYPHYIL